MSTITNNITGEIENHKFGEMTIENTEFTMRTATKSTYSEDGEIETETFEFFNEGSDLKMILDHTGNGMMTFWFGDEETERGFVSVLNRFTFASSKFGWVSMRELESKMTHKLGINGSFKIA